MSAIVSGNVQSCGAPYPSSCVNGTRSFDTCSAGFIGCDTATNSCPFLFKDNASLQADVFGGLYGLGIAIGIIAICMFVIVRMVYRMMIDTPIEVIAKITNVNDYLLIIFGCGTTMCLGSSSVTEAIFNPALAYGIIESEKVSNIRYIYICIVEYTFFSDKISSNFQLYLN